MLIVSLAIALLVTLVIAFASRLDSVGRDGWKTYRNTRYEYEIRYPADWLIEVRDPQPGDDFETQYVVLTKGIAQGAAEGAVAQVLVAVNFQGDWCTAGQVTVVREVVVSGVRGDEYVCSLGVGAGCQSLTACQEGPQNIVRYFEGAKGKLNYTVWSKPLGESETVRKIIEAFRFLE